MAYVIEKRKEQISIDRLPIRKTLRSGRVVELVGIVESDYPAVHQMLNEVIVEGNSYPQLETLDEAGFRAYYVSHDAFVLKDISPTESGFEGNGRIIGAFYIKPNFPGRCNHICNGGFLVKKEFRREGAGNFLGQMFLLLAKDLGYKGSFFNLVFEDNPGSLNLWRSLNFQEVGVVPNARLNNDGSFVNAHQFYYDLTKVQG